MKALTDIQQRVFEFVATAMRTGGIPPTQWEIADKFGFSSHRAVQCHLHALKQKGWLLSDPGKARSLRLGPSAGPQRGRVVDIPLFGSIPAGLGADREQQADGCVSIDIATLGFKPGRNTFALRVTGDSMIGKHILDGDTVILEHGPDPRPGQVVAALIDGKSTLKTFVVKRGKPYLQAENPKYPDLYPAEDLMIQGVVRTVIRHL